MKQIKGLCADLAEKLELPAEAVGDALRLTALDDRRLLIEKHRGLLAYGTEEIRVSTGYGQLVLRGEALQMRAMNRSELLITGRLRSLVWERA
ncbi:MAG: sporulation protein [Oscillospiraceae bacterium]|nr:sporulation protein [Oscillospiraceae bacterium]